MPARPPPPGQSRFDRETAWRAAYGLTEAQSELVVALIAARLLGYDGATGEELSRIGIMLSAVGDLAELSRMRLVECVGLTSERHPRKIWGPCPTAFRWFNVAETAPPPNYVETIEGRAAWAHEQLAERRRRADQRRRERMGQGAA